MTGPAVGSWYPLGAAIKNMVEQDVSGTTVDIRPGAGLINLRAVSEGKADLGMGNVISTVDAVNGNPPFDKKLPGICNLASSYTPFAQPAAADAPLKTLAALKGKKFPTPPRGK